MRHIQETCKRGAVFPLSLSDFADVAGMAYSLHISFKEGEEIVELRSRGDTSTSTQTR